MVDSWSSHVLKNLRSLSTNGRFIVEMFSEEASRLCYIFGSEGRWYIFWVNMIRWSSFLGPDIHVNSGTMPHPVCVKLNSIYMFSLMRSSKSDVAHDYDGPDVTVSVWSICAVWDMYHFLCMCVSTLYGKASSFVIRIVVPDRVVGYSLLIVPH